MANKTKTVKGNSPALGVKMATSAAIMLATTKATTKEEEELKAVIAGLKSELDAERRSHRLLRREKEVEVLKVRNEELTKSSIALKDLSKRLLEEKQRELELQRESMRNKLDSDLGKIVKLKQRDVAKLRGDLARCQDQLKEELSNRGLSTSSRATFDSERHKLLQEVRDLQLAKRQLEDRLTEAGETEKRLQLEVKRLQESCKLDLARVEREANVEVKKLLDELKTKDHMLEQMDRQIYPDRSTVLKNIVDRLSVEEMLSIGRQTNKWNNGSARSSSCSGRISVLTNERYNSCCSNDSNNSKCAENDSSNGGCVNDSKNDSRSVENVNRCVNDSRRDSRCVKNDSRSVNDSRSDCVGNDSRCVNDSRNDTDKSCNSSMTDSGISCACEDKNSCTCNNTTINNSCICDNTSSCMSNFSNQCNTVNITNGNSYVCEGSSNITCQNSKNNNSMCQNSSNCACSGSSNKKNNSMNTNQYIDLSKVNNNSCNKRVSKRSSSAGSKNCSKVRGTVNGRRCRSASGHQSKANHCTRDLYGILGCNSCGINAINSNEENGVSGPVKISKLNGDADVVSSSTITTTTSWATTSGCTTQTTNLQKKLQESEQKVKLVEGLHRAEVERHNSLSTSSKQLENKVKSLNTQLRNMRKEQESNRKEIKRLNDVIVSKKRNEVDDLDSKVNARSEAEFYSRRCSELDQVLVSLRHDCQEKDRRIGLLIKSQQKRRHKYEPKTVRFMLPDDTEEMTSDVTESTETSSLSSSCSDPVLDDELLIQSMHRDYETLMEEHLKLEKYCASLSTNHSAVNQEVHVKKESLDLQAMEEKLRLADDREQRLKHQYQEICNQNEELEFRILELEECSERNMSASYTENEDDVAIKNQKLQEEVEKLRQRLSQYECIDVLELEKDASSPLPVPGATETPDPQRLSMENLRKLTASLSDSDEDNQMVQSFSTMTSGFDEISCISLELDDRTEMPDMPAEEEADLEKDADDIGPEMPTEECDDFSNLDESAGENLEPHDAETLSQLGELSFGSNEPELSEHSTDISFKTSDLELIVDQESHADTAVPELTNPDSDQKCSSQIAAQRNQDTGCNAENIVDEPLTKDSLYNTSGVCDCSTQRIKYLQDQVEILKHVDSKYSATIETLNEIECQLIAVLPTGFVEPKSTSEENCDQPNNADLFWINSNEEIEGTIAAAENEMKNLGGTIEQEEDKVELCEEKIETLLVFEHCIATLQNTGKILQQENNVCQDLERRIEELEQRQASESSDNFDNLYYNSSECLPYHTTLLYPTADSSVLGSLKRLAFDVVTAGFRTDFLELKSLTHDFFSATVEDELNDIAFIDEDDSACVPSDASSTAELEGPSRLQMRNELRLNTKMSSMNQRFDFLSPTSFDNPDWSNSSHLEAVNHCLFQQIEDLEKERDSLKDIVYRDDSVINDMTQQISRLENSEQELNKIVCRLEASDDQASELIVKLETQCQEFRVKLSRAESVENSLRSELDSREKSEEKMEAKLLRSVESLEKTTTKLRSNLQEVEKAKMDAEKHSDELNILVHSLQSKDCNSLQRILSLENLCDDLKQKTTDLETSLNSAYDEVSGLTKQKDGLAQKLNTLVDEIADLRVENDELLVEKRNLTSEVDRLSESEIFLKEANRKMWLSLQANIEERDAGLNRVCKNCEHDQNECRVDEESQEINKIEFMRDSCAQTDLPAHCELRNSPTTGKDCRAFLALLVLQNHLAITEGHFGSKHGRSGPIGQTDKSKGSLVTERKARLEEMLKFVSSRKICLGANQLQVPANGTTGQDDKTAGDISEPSDGDVSDLEPVEGEEEFWSVVERYDDIYDVRAADTWNMWRHLEQDIMGLNLEQLKKLLEESEKLEEKSCQAAPNQPPLHSTSQHSQHEIPAHKDEKESTGEKDFKELELPPLPASLPPKEGMESADPRICNVINCSENFTQTDLGEAFADSGLKPADLMALRHQLNQNERALNAQKNEVNRLTLEMRSWQQTALAASEQVERLTTELGTAQQHSGLSQHTTSITDSKTPQVMRSDRRSRVELPSSQIPVSVKRAVDFYSSISLRSGSTSPSPTPRTPSMIPRLAPGSVALTTTQGPVSNESSSSAQQQQPSQIPRLSPDWIQQQQQLYQGQQQQPGGDGTRYHSADDEHQQTAASSFTLPAAAATASSYPAAESETEVPILPFHEEKEEGSF